MLDFIIYTQPREFKFKNDKKRYTVEELKDAPRSSRIPELEKVKEGTLEFVAEIGEYRLFRFICSYIQRHGATLAEVRDRPLDYWQSKNGCLVISFGFPRSVAKIGVTLLSFATFGDPMLITEFPLFNSDFLRLKAKVKELNGSLTLIDIRRVSWGGGKLRQLMMKGDKLERIPGLEEVLQNVERISSLGFSIPSIRGVTRQFSFRLTDWGGGQIYSPPDPQPHELAEFFAFLEESLLL